jgi:hypothetical protein
VYQSTIFTAAEEDTFEGGDSQLPAAKFESSRIVLSPKFDTSRIVPVHRLFLNERKGSVGLDVEISFDADLDSLDQPFAGHATVTIRNVEPEPDEVHGGEIVPGRYRGGVIVPVSVYETRVATKTGETEEFLADQMTVHLVPSFVVLGAEYFSDRRDGLSTMNNMFAEISDRYAISQAAIPTDPEWQVRRRAVEEVAKIRALEEFERAEPSVARRMQRRFQLPVG